MREFLVSALKYKNISLIHIRNQQIFTVWKNHIIFI